MSSENRFERTFSRKKKQNKKSTDEKGKDKQQGDEDNIDEHRVLLLGLAAQPLIPPTPKKIKSQTPIKKEGKPVNKNKKVVAESPKPKKKIVTGSPEQKVKEKRRHVEEEEKKKKKKKKEEEKEEEPFKNDGNKGECETWKPKRKADCEGGETVGSKKQNKKKDKGGEVEVEKEREESSECKFATNRIVKIIKSEAPDYRISQESILVINKAAEKFIALFAEDSYDCAVRDKKSFIGYKHLSTAVSHKKKFDFLSDFVPEKVLAEKALVERKSAET